MQGPLTGKQGRRPCPPSNRRKAMRKTVALILAASVVALAPAAASPASAGKPAPAGSSSLVLDQAGPHVVGDVVTFTPTTTATTKPWEQLKCYQGVTLVLNESHPDYW